MNFTSACCGCLAALWLIAYLPVIAYAWQEPPAYPFGKELVTPEELPRYLEMLDDEDPVIRRAAVFFLGQIEELDHDVRSRLVALLEDPNPRVQMTAAWAVTGRYFDEELIIPLMESEDYHTRLAAAAVFGFAGYEDERALEIACNALPKETEFRRVLIHIIETIGADSPDSVVAMEAAIREILHYTDYYHRGIVEDYLASMGNLGPQSLDIALELCHHEDHQVRRAAYCLVGDQAMKHSEEIAWVVSARQNPDESTGKIEHLYPTAVRLIDEVLPVLENRLYVEDSLYSASPRLLVALLLIGSPGFDVLDRAMYDADPTAHANVFLALEYYAHLLPDYTPVLFSHVESANLSSSREAAELLIKIGWRRPEIRQQLFDLIDSESPNAREAAVAAMEEYAEIVPEMKTQVLSALEDPDGFVRIKAVYALKAFNFEEGETTEAVAKLLSGIEADELNGLLGYLYGLGADGVPLLRECLESSDPVIRRKVIGVLGDIGADSAAAIPDLVILLDDEDILVRQWAVQNIGRIGAMPEVAVPVLVALLDSDEYVIRAKSIEALGLFHAEAAGAVPRLTEILADDDVLMQEAVLFALARIGPAAGAAVADIQALVADPHIGALAEHALSYIVVNEEAQ